ncbi:MAG: insulinase family protein [Spirochaetaceae bacterium]|jgi:Zn-dependent M16 (insulinase) family peptidase|nr:insulinase family protein [Spirochaetaceae bacterium]
MYTGFKQGDRTDSGFEILDVVPLEELDAVGVYARHCASGAEVFHVYNNDAENTFAFAFKTLPEDSTGVFHILEHAVLCGSESFPLKDTFMVLAQGSLQTYLNAWTFPDKTVYPASSVNEKDYFNLLRVYGDAVLHPTLAEWTFLQEGRRFELARNEKGAEQLSVNGVVYNEMKGAYSALDEYAGQWAVRSVLPDTLYAFDSGGDPACIPHLNYEDFLRAHKKFYAPANTKIFLCGNIPTERQLAFLNDVFFAQEEAGERAPEVPPVLRWNAPRSLDVPSPAAPGNKPTVFISWLCGEFDFSGGAGDEACFRALAMDVLCAILLGHDGAPLAKTLTTCGLGEDLADISGFDDELKFHIFTVGLRGVKNPRYARALERRILRKLSRLAAWGIPRRDIEAALFDEEFSEREIKRSGSGGPWALALLRRSLRAWMHGAPPWASLVVKKNFERLKAEYAHDRRFFEKLLKECLVDNPHRALVTVKPDAAWSERLERDYKTYIQQKERELDDVQKNDIRQKQAMLERIQNTADAPAALAAIPHLARHDLDRDITRVPRSLRGAGGLPVVAHAVNTNGVQYVRLAMPLDVLPREDYIYVPFFAHCITSMGMKGRNWAAVAGDLACVAGDFYAAPHASECLDAGTHGGGGWPQDLADMPDLRGRDWLVFTLKTLDEKLESALELATRIIAHANFSDMRRLWTLTLEARNHARAALAPSGTMLASLRAARHLSRSGGVNEVWFGLTQLEFAATLPDMPVRALAARFSRMRDVLTGTAGALAHVACGEAQMERSLALVQKYAAPFGPPCMPRKEALVFGGEGRRVEVFSSATLQVGFSALGVRGAGFTSQPESAAERALAHYLSTGALWENLRMKCGAYGANCVVSPLQRSVQFSTYRDPKPELSIASMPAILREIADGPLDGDALEKTIIGLYAKLKHPRTNGKAAAVSFFQFLEGIEEDVILRQLCAALDLRAGDMRLAAEGFAARVRGGGAAVGSPPVSDGEGVCILCGAPAAAGAAAAFGVSAREVVL